MKNRIFKDDSADERKSVIEQVEWIERNLKSNDHGWVRALLKMVSRPVRVKLKKLAVELGWTEAQALLGVLKISIPVARKMITAGEGRKVGRFLPSKNIEN